MSFKNSSFNARDVAQKQSICLACVDPGFNTKNHREEKFHLESGIMSNPVILAFWGLRWEYLEFRDILGYIQTLCQERKENSSLVLAPQAGGCSVPFHSTN